MAEPFLREITPGNLLSFGPNPEPIKLNQLNILIGANGSGKSNLIEVIHLLRSTPGDLRSAFRPGRFAEWIWHSNTNHSADIISDVEFGDYFIRHVLKMISNNQGFSIDDEQIDKMSDKRELVQFISDQRNIVVLDKQGGVNVMPVAFSGIESVLSKVQDPNNFPLLFNLGSFYRGICIYREWEFGRNSTLRQPQSTDLRHEILEEDFSNLAMHLNYLRSFPPVRRKLIEKLQNVFAGITDFDVSVVGGTAQLYLIEGDYRIPATRLSDGTLRYLCLLAILCNPEPQPLICLEEPELGLHPDLLSGLVDLIKECSERTQMIVTTHSEFIVDGFSESPECVMVVDKEEGITKMKRLSYDSLKVWLEEYSLGQLWNQGQIGGTRW